MDLGGKKLDEWFLEQRSNPNLNIFPHGDNYYKRYDEISEQLYKWVHPEVSTGSMISNLESGKRDVLTNHGIDHIKSLIGRLSQFVDKNPFCTLSNFEAYLLLMAAHTHDVGNIISRNGHEFNSRTIIEKLGTGLVGQDEWIWEYIYDIAKAHKGEQIHLLPEQDHLHEIPFRPQFLAAMLKFADELAENFSRASSINLALGQIPEESMLYHVYANVINSIIPKCETREIQMIFNVKEDQLCRLYKKDDGEIYLLDEIYLRTLKTYSERVYCMKYTRPYINFDIIKVTINIKYNNGLKIQNGYEIAERGIEKVNMEEAFKLCPKLKEITGKVIHDSIMASKAN